jgi:hypothetical protein
MKNEGMVADHRLASKRSERAALLAYSGVGTILTNIILWWPFDFYMWLAEGVIAALTVAFAVTGWDYKRKAEQIEKAWSESARLPG